MNNLKSNLVISHKNCLDGFGAAYAAWSILGDQDTEYVFLDYPDRVEFLARDPSYFKGRYIYIFDVSFNRSDLFFLQTQAHQIVWRDHHETAFKDYLNIKQGMQIPTNYVETQSNLDVYLDNNKSGAWLAWEYFYTSNPPMWVQHIDDRDRWQWKLKGTREFCMRLSQLTQTFIDWNLLLNRTFLNDTYVEGALLCTYFDEQLERGINATKQELTINGIKGLCCNLPPVFASEAGNELAKQSGTFGATWFQDKTGAIKFSLRSIGDFSVRELAEQFGGGGHKNAAGFSVLPEFTDFITSRELNSNDTSSVLP